MNLIDAPHTTLDKFGSLVGKATPRIGIERLLHGRGQYLADITLPRMLHLVFVRSPYAHAKVANIETRQAQSAPGVARILSGAELAQCCKPFIAAAANRKGHKSAPQYPMAVDRAVWQGQPVVAVVATTRAQAEDAAELVEIDWEVLPSVCDAVAAVTDDAYVIHPELGDNLAFEALTHAGDPESEFRRAHTVVEHVFKFERQTAVTLEPRGVLADFDPSQQYLTVYHSHQSPSQMQAVFSKHLDLPEHKVRVIVPDIGGGFGLKINTYAEELAVAAISKLMARPIRYCADRIESFLSDAHARDHTVKARMAVSSEGRITAMEVDDLAAIGAFGMPLRYNIAEGMMLTHMAGAPYDFENYKARTRSVYVNKNLIGMYRGVGMPLACVVTEVLADLAAHKMQLDPVEFKRANFRSAANLPCITPSGAHLDSVSFEQCMEKLVSNMNYSALRQEQATLRKQGIYRGIGIATFVEQTSYGPPYYGPTSAEISVQDACMLKLEPSGAIRCLTSTTDQGQGTLTGLAQIVATGVGVDLSMIEMVSGDSRAAPYGGGAWGSRGMAVGGEAALKAALQMKKNILDLAAAITHMDSSSLDTHNGDVVRADNLEQVISIAEVARIGYYRQDTLPKNYVPQLQTTGSHVANEHLYYMANGVQGCYLELDAETGIIKILGHWAVDDCGRVINPLLVDEQVRGGVVQGLGSALYEECIYSENGSLVNGTMAEYLVPMASEMPDIHVSHIESKERSTQLGAKGIGEAGLIGAIGAVWVAVNDALKPFNVTALHQPFTPDRILAALSATTEN